MNTHKAIEKVNEILDSFANRISSQTWICRTNYKSLDKVIKHLKSIQDENVSVGVYIMKRYGLKKYAVIGKNLYEKHGGVPIAYSEKIHEHLKRKEKLIKESAYIAAVFHDLGKNEKKFQERLWEKKKQFADIRHEIVTLQYLLKWNEFTDSKNPELFFKKEMLINGENIIKNVAGNFLIRFFEKIFNRESVALRDIIMYVILTHHRQTSFKVLFTGNEKSSPFFLNLLEKMKKVPERRKTYILNETIKKLAGECKINHQGGRTKDSHGLKIYVCDKERIIEPFCYEGEFINFVNQNIKENEETLNKKVEYKEILKYYFYIREILMLSDHYVSSKKEENLVKENENLKKSYLMANNNQFLIHHLKSVAKNTQNVFYEFFQEKKNEVLMVSKELFNIKNERFKWQNNIFELIKQYRSGDKSPLLIFNGVETGGGKTIGNAKIAQALGSSAYNVVYPLRTLGIQTAEVFNSMTGIPKEKIALVVGDSPSESETMSERNEYMAEKTDDAEFIYVYDREKGIFKKIKDYEENDESSGTFNDKIENDALDYQTRNKEKMRKFYNTPVVIGTIDYLMKATYNQKSRFLLSMARIIKSDLIVIDELDNLGYEDVVAVMKLVYLCGALEKDLVISTATLNEVYKEYVKKFYLAGYKNDLKILDFNQKKIEAYERSYDKNIEKKTYSGKVVKNDKKSGLYHIKVSFHECLKKNDTSLNIELLHRTIENLSDKHNVTIKLNKEEMRCSIGLVKIFYKNVCVKNYLEYAKFLDNVKDENTILVLLHSDLPEKLKNETDILLNKLLNRNNLTENEKILKEFFEYNFKDKKYDKSRPLKVVVFATPLIDTGKDFDFDWGIGEYRNASNANQTAGRVNRHRRTPVKDINFILFPPLFGKAKRKDSFYLVKSADYSKGDFDVFEGIREYFAQKGVVYNKITDKEVFDFIKTEINNIGKFNFHNLKNSKLFKFEEKYIANRLKKRLDKYLNDFIFLTADFEKENPFRKNVSTQEILEIKNKSLLNQVGRVSPIEQNEILYLYRFLSKNLLCNFSPKEDFVIYKIYSDEEQNFVFDYYLGVFKDSVIKSLREE